MVKNKYFLLFNFPVGTYRYKHGGTYRYVERLFIYTGTCAKTMKFDTYFNTFQEKIWTIYVTKSYNYSIFFYKQKPARTRRLHRPTNRDPFSAEPDPFSEYRSTQLPVKNKNRKIDSAGVKRLRSGSKSETGSWFKLGQIRQILMHLDPQHGTEFMTSYYLITQNRKLTIQFITHMGHIKQRYESEMISYGSGYDLLWVPDPDPTSLFFLFILGNCEKKF